MSLNQESGGEPTAQPAHALTPAQPAESCADNPRVDCERTQRKVVSHILQHAEPALLPAKWAFLTPTRNIQTLSCSPAELLASLKECFTEQQLWDAKVLVADSSNEPQLTLVLRTTFQVIWNEHGEPIDLASDAGLLLSADLPCFRYACLRVDDIVSDKRVFIGALADLQIMECLGFRCAPDAGLAFLDGQQARRLYANLSESSVPRYWPILIGISIANLEYELPSHIMPILNRLDVANELYSTGNNLFGIWQPGEKRFDRIAKAVTFSDRTIVRHVIRATFDDSITYDVGAFLPRREPDQNELELAHANLRRAIVTRDPFGFQYDLKAALVRLRQAITRITSERFIQAAAIAATPLESQAHLLRAEIARDLNEAYVLFNAAESSDRDWKLRLTEEMWEIMERSTNQLLKLERLAPMQK